MKEFWYIVTTSTTNESPTKVRNKVCELQLIQQELRFRRQGYK